MATTHHSDPAQAHREVRALARELAEGEIAPHAADWNARHHIPRDLLRTMGELGLLGVLVPEDLGGAGLDHSALCHVIEEIARVDAGVSVTIAVHNGLGAGSLLAAGTEGQRHRWLPDMASGASLAAYGLTEPDAGSDTAGLKTAATRRDDGSFVLQGSKTWVTNGGIAGLFIVFARTDGPGARGVSAFVVEHGEGLEVGPEIAKMGLHTSSTTELRFDKHVLEPDRLLGSRGEGLRIALGTLDGGRITIAAQAVGIATAALEVATSYARQRYAFGGPIARFQGVQFPLADVAAKLDAARLLTYHAAGLRDAGKPHQAAGAKAKLFASAVAVEAANVAVQTLGGYGYSAELPAERLYRDAKITEIYEGTSQIQRLVIARDLLGDAARG